MSLFDNPENLLLLKKLIYPNDKEDSSSDSENEYQSDNKNLGPASFGLEPESTTTDKSHDKQSNDRTKRETSIEEWFSEQEKEDNEILETRKRPEYTIKYKQSVGTEDVFLQMGNRTCASSSCEDMIVEIIIPEETVEVHQMDISVTETVIDFASPMYRLKLPLTQPINPDKSTAKYYTDKKTLCLTCRMNRPYDFVNF